MGYCFSVLSTIGKTAKVQDLESNA